MLQYEIAMQSAQEAGIDISNVTPEERIHLFVEEETGLESAEMCEQSGEIKSPDTALPPSAETTKGMTLKDNYILLS